MREEIINVGAGVGTDREEGITIEKMICEDVVIMTGIEVSLTEEGMI